jgi:hypothetical protein
VPSKAASNIVTRRVSAIVGICEKRMSKHLIIIDCPDVDAWNWISVIIFQALKHQDGFDNWFDFKMQTWSQEDIEYNSGDLGSVPESVIGITITRKL